MLFPRQKRFIFYISFQINIIQYNKIKNLMKYSSLIFLFIITLSLIQLTKSQCSSCQNLTYLSCNICYDTCSNQSNTQFQKCQYNNCTNYAYDQNNTRYCQKSQIVQLTQSQCFITCCQSSVSIFSIDQLDRCRQKNKQLMIRTILISVVAGVGFFAIFILCFCCIKRRGLSCSCFGDCCGRIGQCTCYMLKCKCCKRNSYPDPIYQIPMGNITSIKWKSDNKINSHINDDNQSCAVCLSNRVNTETICKHFYHIQCLIQWFNRNPNCPLCKRYCIQNVKFYCRGCCNEYVDLNFRVQRDLERIILAIKGPNCPKCQ